jgi:hypothetical protein
MPSPQAGARRRPAQINYDFSQVDDLIDRARQHGIRVHLTLTGPSPRWVNARRSMNQSWYKPNPREFGDFAGVVAKHFKGRVDRYSIWNEPNWKTWLGPLDPGAHYLEGEPGDVAAYLLTLDAVNFGSGWFPTLRRRPGRSGYFTVAWALADRFRAHGRGPTPNCARSTG